MFQTSDLVPLLAERGVTLSREQVYRLVTQPPQRMSMDTLVALCGIMRLVQGAVACTGRSTLQVGKRIGLYACVRIEGGGWGSRRPGRCCCRDGSQGGPVHRGIDGIGAVAQAAGGALTRQGPALLMSPLCGR